MTPTRQKLARDSLGLALTQYTVRAISMARGFVAAKVLDPMSFGAWNAIQLMMDYGALAPLGTQQGLDQLVPVRLVEADAERTLRLKRAALFNVIVLSLLFAALGLAWASVGSSRMRATWHLTGLGMAFACVLFVNLANMGTSILRSHGDIGGLKRWFVIQGFVGSGLGLVLMAWYGRWGLLWGWLAGCFAAFLFVVYRGRRVLPHTPSPALEGLDLLQVGIPLYVFTASGLVMRNLDRIVVLRFLGTQALGYYGLSVNVLTLLMAVPDSLAYVSYPQLVRRYNEAGEDTAAIRERVDRLVRGVAVTLPLAACFAALWARDLVHAVLPRYDACVPPLRILAFGAVGLSLSTFASIVLMTVGRRIILVPAAVFLSALSGGLQLLSLRWNGGLAGIAMAASSAYLLSGGVLLTLAAVGLRYTFGRGLELIVRCVAPTGIGALLTLGILQLLLREPSPLSAQRVLMLVLASLLCAAGYVLLVVPFAHGIGLRSLVAESELPVLSGLCRAWIARSSGPRP
jgi:O-antigen/teichoic acid export membrane protein